MGADSVYTIEIRTEADLAKAQQLKRDLEKLAEAAKAAGKSHDQYEENIKAVDAALNSAEAKEIKYASSLNKVQEALSDASKELTKHGLELRKVEEQGEHAAAKGTTPTGSPLETLTTRAAGALVALASVRGAINLAVDSLKEFAGAEAAIVQRDAALAQHGQLIGNVREQYSQLADELSKATGFATGEWTQVLTTLTKFGASASQIEKAAEGVKNLAGFLGGDLKSAAFVVGKALQGNISMLERFGIKIDETKPKAEQLKDLFEELARRGGGQLEARMETLAGKTAVLKNAASDAKEAFGGWLLRLGLVQIGMQMLTDVMRGAKAGFEKPTEQAKELKNNFVELVDSTRDFAGEMERAVKQVESLTKALDQQNKIVEARLQMAAAASDEKVANLLAGIAEQEAEGKLTPAQAAARRGEVTRAAAFDKAQNAHLAALMSRGALEEQRTKAESDLSDAELALNFAQARGGIGPAAPERMTAIRDRLLKQGISFEKLRDLESQPVDAESLRALEQKVDAARNRRDALFGEENTDRLRNATVSEDRARHQLGSLRAEARGSRATEQAAIRKEEIEQAGHTVAGRVDNLAQTVVNELNRMGDRISAAEAKVAVAGQRLNKSQNF